jgi:hypothetical protein
MSSNSQGRLGGGRVLLLFLKIGIRCCDISSILGSESFLGNLGSCPRMKRQLDFLTSMLLIIGTVFERKQEKDSGSWIESMPALC